MRPGGHGLLLAAVFLAAPSAISAKGLQPADEAAVREIVRQVYEGYSKPIPEAPEDGSYAPDNEIGSAVDGYEPPYSASLDALIQKWMPYGSGDEVMGMNDFDWYCQCQDFDSKSAHIVSQSYKAKGANKIVGKVVFDPVGGSGAPLIFTFVREPSGWALDDLKFNEGGTLRSGLAQDIADGEKAGGPQ